MITDIVPRGRETEEICVLSSLGGYVFKSVNAYTKAIKTADEFIEALTLKAYAPSIDTWVGKWILSAMQGSCDITISKVEDEENMLKGTFTTGGYTYNIGLDFDPETGNLNLPSQLIEDPSGRYPALWLMNADLNQGMLLGQGGMNVVWHGVSQEGDFEDDGTLASEGYASDTFVALACTAKGEPIKENGQYVFVIEWYYLSNLTPNK